jgi:hypothetical protein
VLSPVARWQGVSKDIIGLHQIESAHHHQMRCRGRTETDFSDTANLSIEHGREIWIHRPGGQHAHRGEAGKTSHLGERARSHEGPIREHAQLFDLVVGVHEKGLIEGSIAVDQCKALPRQGPALKCGEGSRDEITGIPELNLVDRIVDINAEAAVNGAVVRFTPATSVKLPPSMYSIVPSPSTSTGKTARTSPLRMSVAKVVSTERVSALSRTTRERPRLAYVVKAPTTMILLALSRTIVRTSQLGEGS